MCNIAEYIVMRRATHIINSLINKTENANKISWFSPICSSTGNIIDSKPFIGPDKTPEMAVRFQRRLEDVFSLVFEGCRFSRFVAVDKTADDTKPCNTIPMYLLEVFEPSHCYIPIYVVDDAVLAVSPFNNPSINRISRNEYLIELFPTALILETINEDGIAGLNECLDQPAIRMADPTGMTLGGVVITYRDFIHDMMLMFNEGVKRQDALLTRGFSDMGSEKVVEVSTESVYFRKMRACYSLESMEKGEELGDGVIDPTDFMPVYLTSKGSNGFAILEDTEKDGKKITRISMKPQVLGLTVNDSSIRAVLCKENTSGVNYFMIELDEWYYVGNNQVVAYINGEIFAPTSLLETHSTFLDNGIDNNPVSEISNEGIMSKVKSGGELIKNGEIFAPTSLLETHSTFLDNGIDNNPVSEISNEGIMSKVKSGGELIKNAGYVLKKFGIKYGSNAAGLITQLFKDVGLKNAKWLLTQFGSTFKRGIDLEKADTLELQEKLLNDQLDSMQENVTFYSKVWFRSVTLSIFCGGLVVFPLAWLISCMRTKKARVNALERLEVRFDNIIERIERKINYAEERSENETVDSLIKERQMYQMARMRLLKMKDDVYNRERIKYATFDKDLTMTRSQRWDAFLTKASNPNYD